MIEFATPDDMRSERVNAEMSQIFEAARTRTICSQAVAMMVETISSDYFYPNPVYKNLFSKLEIFSCDEWGKRGKISLNGEQAYRLLVLLFGATGTLIFDAELADSLESEGIYSHLMEIVQSKPEELSKILSAFGNGWQNFQRLHKDLLFTPIEKKRKVYFIGRARQVFHGIINEYCGGDPRNLDPVAISLSVANRMFGTNTSSEAVFVDERGLVVSMLAEYDQAVGDD